MLPPAISSVITWKGQALFPNTPSSFASDGSAFMLNPQRALNSKFGPTYPPSSHPSFPEEAVLSYPGVVFAFYTDGPAVVKSNGRQPADGSQSPRDTANQKCPLTRIVVSRHDPSAVHASAYPDISKLEQNHVPYTVAEGDIAYVDIEVGLVSRDHGAFRLVHFAT